MSAPAKVLVIFDSPSVRETVSVVDLGPEFQVTVCDNPANAEAEVESGSPQLVAICAVSNPGAAYDLCRRLKESSRDVYLPVVLLPVRMAVGDLERAQDAGADDCVPISLAPEQVAMRLTSLLRAKALFDDSLSQTSDAQARVKNMAQANLEAADEIIKTEERERRIRAQNEELERRAKSLAEANAEAAHLVMELEERDRRIQEQAAVIADNLKTIQDELDVAKSLQIQLLPSRHPSVKGLLVFDRFMPAAELCGDYYDYFTHEDGCFDVVIADVTGHGVAPALVALQIRALARSEARQDVSLSETVSTLNRFMVENFEAGYLMSMFYLRYHPGTGSIEYVGAGHNPFLVARRAGGVESFRSQGTLLGVMAAAEYPQDTITIEPGDRLLLYTDGIVEVLDNDEIQWGDEQLVEAFGGGASLSGRELLDGLVREAAYHGGNTPFHDDVTMVLMERTE